MIKGIPKRSLGNSSCINTSRDPSKGVSSRSCTSSKISSDLKHASITSNLATTPKGSPVSSPVSELKGRMNHVRIGQHQYCPRVMLSKVEYNMRNKDINQYYDQKSYTSHTKKGHNEIQNRTHKDQEMNIQKYDQPFQTQMNPKQMLRQHFYYENPNTLTEYSFYYSHPHQQCPIFFIY